ncbi:MAG: hypothetical protein L0I76_16350 [Pseudonocardia sp.]|nr:hypothetical protein [Pseudonocardia sp.]
MLRLGVQAGADPRRVERLTRELHDALTADDDVRAAGITVSPAPPPEAEPGAKGTIETAAALIVLGRYFARPAADALIAAIQSWCARDRRVTVTLTDGDRSIDIVGSPTGAQKDMVEGFWRDGQNSR